MQEKILQELYLEKPDLYHFLMFSLSTEGAMELINWAQSKVIPIEPPVILPKPKVNCNNCKYFIDYDLQKDLQSACINEESEVKWVSNPEFFGCTFFEYKQA